MQQPLKQLLIFFYKEAERLWQKHLQQRRRQPKRQLLRQQSQRKAVAQYKAAPEIAQATMAQETQKNAFEEKFGEGTAFDLDYGKLLIIALCVYIAVQVS